MNYTIPFSVKITGIRIWVKCTAFLIFTVMISNLAYGNVPWHSRVITADFEDFQLDAWRYASGNMSSVISVKQSRTGIGSLKLSGSGTDNQSASYPFYDNLMPIGISFSARASQTDSDCGSVSCKSTETPSPALVSFMFGGDGHFYLNSTQHDTYQADTWYDIHFDIDRNSQTVGIYVDNTLVAETAYCNSASTVHTLQLSNTQDGEVFFDNFRIEDSKQSYAWEFFRDTFEDGNLDSWSPATGGISSVITTSDAFTGSRCLELSGAGSANQALIRTFCQRIEPVQVSFAALARQTDSHTGHVRLMSRETPNSAIASFNFGSDGHFHINGIQRGTYLPNTCYRIRFDIDRKTGRTRVYIDEQLLGDGGYDNGASTAHSLELYNVGSGTVLIDDIIIRTQDYFVDRFEASTLKGWNPPGSGMSSVVSTEQAYTGSSSLKLTGSGSSADAATYPFGEDIEPIQVSFSVLAKQTDKYTGYVRLMSRETPNSAIASFNFGSDGHFHINGLQRGTYHTDTWYRIQFDIDREFERISVYIDGQLLGEEDYFNDACTAHTLELYNAWSGTVFIDDIQIKTKSAMRVSPSHEISQYPQEGMFLVSDQAWQCAVATSPLAAWSKASMGEITSIGTPFGTATNTCVYPMLICHVENGQADLDPILQFISDAQIKNISTMGSFPQNALNELSNHCTVDAAESCLNYYNQPKAVICAENDYETASLAACYASALGLPLIIAGYNDNVDLSHYYKIGVGACSTLCNDSMTLDELYSRYIAVIGGDKIILSTTSDLKMCDSTGGLPLEWTSGLFSKMYQNISLITPYLAAARRQVPIYYNVGDAHVNNIDRFIEDSLKQLGLLEAEYLTIVSAPKVIPQAKNRSGKFTQVDGSHYGDLNGDHYQDLKTGRIYSYSCSGASASVARSLFYHYCSVPKSHLVITDFASSFGGDFSVNLYIDHALSHLGFSGKHLALECYKHMDIRELCKRAYIAHASHGYTEGGTRGVNITELRTKLVWMNSTIAGSEACSTASYDKAAKKSRLFSAEMIRRGCIAYIGATDDTSSYNPPLVAFFNRLANKRDLGTAFMEASRNGFADLYHPYELFFMLIGDPCFNPGYDSQGGADLSSLLMLPMQKGSTNYELPVSITLYQAPVSKLTHVRQFPATYMDVMAKPAAGGESLASGKNWCVKRLSTVFTVPYETHRIIVKGHPDKKFAGFAYCIRTIGGKSVDILQELNAATGNYNDKMTADGDTVVRFPLIYGKKNEIHAGTTVVPEMKFDLGLIFEPK